MTYEIAIQVLKQASIQALITIKLAYVYIEVNVFRSFVFYRTKHSLQSIEMLRIINRRFSSMQIFKPRSDLRNY